MAVASLLHNVVMLKSCSVKVAFNNFTSVCKEGDLVYIHFSCHGQPVEDLNGDEPEGWDEALVPIDAKKVYQKGVYEGKNHIIDDELNEYLREIRTKVGKNGFVYVVVDACHAGSSYRGDEEERITRGTNRGFTASNKPFVPKIDKRGKIEMQNSECKMQNRRCGARRKRLQRRLNCYL